MGNKSSKKHYKVPPNAERPDPPGKPLAEVHVDGIYLAWPTPKSNGNCPIIGYIIQHSEVDDGRWVSSNPIPGNECLIRNLEDGGTYRFRVVAENLIGYSSPSPSSEPFLITNDSVPPRIVTGLRNLSAIENEKVEFHVQVTGNPTPQLAWYLNGEEVFSSMNFMLHEQSFIISRATVDIEGEIMCSATNEFGTETTTAELSVGAPPRIIEDSSREIIFRVDELLRIKFTFTGRPKPEVTWFHDGVILGPERNSIEVLANSTSLKVEHPNRSHRGEYTIRVDNNLGYDTGSVLVTVADKPSPPTPPTVVMLRDNSCLLEWGEGPDDGGCPVQCFIVEYFRTGWDVWLTGVTSRGKSTKIRDLIPGSKYKFRIKAENLYGLSEPSEESVELFIPELSSGLMTTLPEAEEETDRGVQSAVVNTTPYKPYRPPSPSVDPIVPSLKDSIIMNEIQTINADDTTKSKIPVNSTRKPLTLTNNVKSSSQRQLQAPISFDARQRPSSPITKPIGYSSNFDHYGNSRSRFSSADRLNTKPWNQPASSKNKPSPIYENVLPHKCISLPRDLPALSKLVLDTKKLGHEIIQSRISRSRSSSLSSSKSHLIIEESSSDENEDHNIITSSLTVLRTGEIMTRRSSREELSNSLEILPKIPLYPSKNSLNSEDFEYYNSIFGKTYCEEVGSGDEEVSEVKNSENSEGMTLLEDQSMGNTNERLDDMDISLNEVVTVGLSLGNRFWWWFCYGIVPICMSIFFFNYILFSNICIMLYIFYRLIMIFFE